VKSIERRKLKGNDFATSVARAQAAIAERRREVTVTVVAAVAIVVVAGGFFWWRASRDAKATNLLAGALAVAEAPVVAPPSPAPGSPPPVQQPGTFRTDHDRLEAALPRLLDAADKYPTTDAGLTARYRAAGVLAELNRYPEAAQRYQEVISRAGRSSIYGRTARLGLGNMQLSQGKNDAAVETFKDLSTDTDSQLPLDGVLMQLGRAYMQAGKKDEATRAFTRVVDEFPQSLYTTEAKEKIQELKKTA
jgi:TolA-binding protein